MNIRLDFINKIEQEYIDKMTAIRSEFMRLDGELRSWSSVATDPAALRTIALARTNLEIACQFTIKSLCLLGEIKETKE